MKLPTPKYFYPRPPHGERRLTYHGRLHGRKYFYPRPPHGERLNPARMPMRFVKFLSTPPAWGATISAEEFNDAIMISIHAPRMGSDSSPDPVDLPHSHFYPRPPHGERQLSDEIAQAILKFLSTPPAWGATKSLRQTGTAYGISIHAPRMGSDTG